MYLIIRTLIEKYFLRSLNTQKISISYLQTAWDMEPFVSKLTTIEIVITFKITIQSIFNNDIQAFSQTSKVQARVHSKITFVAQKF